MSDKIEYYKDMGKPILTPTEVLKTRGIKGSIPDCCNAIICFRGKIGSEQLIEKFSGEPIYEEILYHSIRLHYSSKFNLLIIPELVYGGPITAIIIEELYTLGIKTLIGFGAGGSINPDIKPGSIFIAKRAICSDGTSKEYSHIENCEPDPQFLNYCFERRNELNVLFLNGLTTDSLYRETSNKIKYWRQLGADFINLEISPFYVVSKVLGIRSIYIGLITDFLGERWSNTHWSENLEAKKKIDAEIIEIIKELVVEKCGDSNE